MNEHQFKDKLNRLVELGGQLHDLNRGKDILDSSRAHTHPEDFSAEWALEDRKNSAQDAINDLQGFLWNAYGRTAAPSYPDAYPLVERPEPELPRQAGTWIMVTGTDQGGGLVLYPPFLAVRQWGYDYWATENPFKPGHWDFLFDPDIVTEFYETTTTAKG